MSRAAQCALNRYERKWNVCEFPDSIFTRCAIDVVRTDVILSVTKGSIDFPLWMCQVVNRIDVQLVMVLLCTTPITNGYRCWWIYVFLIFIYLSHFNGECRSSWWVLHGWERRRWSASSCTPVTAPDTDQLSRICTRSNSIAKVQNSAI